MNLDLNLFIALDALLQERSVTRAATASTPAGRQMRMLGIEPRIQVITESFLTVPGLVAGSERIALLRVLTPSY